MTNRKIWRFGACSLTVVALTFWIAFPESPRTQALKGSVRASHSEIQRINSTAPNNFRNLQPINLREAGSLNSIYTGPAKLRDALSQNQTRPLTLASGDFDEDGVADLVCGYASSGGGLLALHRGNIDALFPRSAVAQQHKARGQFTDSAFLSQIRAFASPEVPDFLAAGDFNADGHWDLVTAARGGDVLYLLSGDGRGKFGTPQPFELPGNATALISGEINRVDGLIDLAVAINGPRGPELLIFESPDGAMKARPEIFDLPNVATALAIGSLNEDVLNDLAVAAGAELLMIRGRDRRLSLDESHRAEVAPAAITGQHFESAIADVAIGDFNHSKLALMFEDGAVQMLGTDLVNAGREANQFIVGQWQSREVFKLSESRGRRFIRARISAQSGEDLLVADSGQLRIIAGGVEMKSASISEADETPAILPMQLNGDALNDLVILRNGQSAPSIMLTAPSATFTVTNNGNSGTGSLRDAITQANSTAGADTINFAIGNGVQTINLLSQLPAITEAVTIDGSTQPGFSGAPLIVLNGAGAGTTANGLLISASNCVIRSLAINGFGHTGVLLDGAGVTGNQIQGCYIGINAAGTAAAPNGTDPNSFDIDGIDILNGANNNTIGGTSVAARNVISGNKGDGIFLAYAGTNNNLVQGNYIGTNAAGTVAIGNGFAPFGNAFGVELATTSSPGPQGNSIGGTVAGAGNLVSGNAGAGVGIFNSDTNNNMVQGNFIGTDANGNSLIPNGLVGVEVGNPPGGGVSARNNLIGGTTPAARNILSGNAGDGVWIRDTGTTGNLIQGNYIGTNVSGLAALPNPLRGVELAFGAQGNTIGGVVAGARNILSGNGESGVGIFNAGTNGNFVQGNLIGLDQTGMARPIKTQTEQTTGGIFSGNARSNHPKFGNAPLGSSQQALNKSVRGLPQNTAAPDAAANAFFGVSISSGAQNNQIGGTSVAARNIISGNANDGVVILQSGTDNNIVQGNFIGLNEAGTSAIPNAAGIEISLGAQSNTIGGAVAGAANVISGNGKAVLFPNGILIASPNTSNNRVLGNFIGTLADGVGSMGNLSHGIALVNTVGNSNSIENGNTIAFNGGAGVYADSGMANRISGNSIHSNAAIGIDLTPTGVNPNDACDSDSGPNNLQNFPVLTAATSGAGGTTIQGMLNSTANTIFTIEFFADAACDASGNGEGKTFIGSMPVSTDAGCTASFSFNFLTMVPVGQVVTATAADPAGNTSEFSTCIQVAAACEYSIAPTSQTFSSAGGSDTVLVTATSGCNWNAVSNDAFIMITSGSSGMGNGMVSYSVLANATSDPRIGTMTIAGKTFTVIQNGLTCAGSISPVSASYTSAGGSGGVMVPAPGGCNWTAISNETWIMVTSGGSGMGNGTVNYSVDPNPGLPRTGTITIAGQLFTVTQSSGLQYYPLPHPIRLFDTRAPIPGFAACEYLSQALVANGELVKQARVTCDGITIPADAVAITGNATVTGALGNGFITLFPDGQPRPPVSNLNFVTGQTVPNAFTVGLGANGMFRTYSFTSTHFILDITGYFAPPTLSGLYYHPLPRPIRLFDTRATIPGFAACEYLNQPLLADSELAKQARITCDGITIPADATAIVGNATVTGAMGNGFITLFPDGQPRPPVSNLNYSTGQTVPNAFTVGLGANGMFRTYAFAGTHFILDVTGYYSPSASDANGTGLLYNPLPLPIRLLDTRAPIPGFAACAYINQPLMADSELVRQARTTCDGITIPSDAVAITGNATVTGAMGNGFITLFPNGQMRPPVSNLNFLTGQTVPNAFTVGLDINGLFRIYSLAGTDFVADVAGFYAP